MLFPIHKATSVESSLPFLRPLPMLLVLSPLPLVASPIIVNEDPLSIGLAVLPISSVGTPIRMDHPTSSAPKTLLPAAFIKRTIRPDLLSYAFLCISHFIPLA
mmetsp:Transcript_36067/g.35041  ORF Transcript_36067/g.35041 Transcript_36067/m.35041 type:complete len:103 (+) Transcript_36067:412-720(+)